LAAGEVDVVLAGGSDALSRLTLTGFNALGAIDKEPCRPFDGRRRGTSLGEGAAFLVLERSERARARGARPVADLVGWALGAEAHHITNPAPDGVLVASLVQRALERAGLATSVIDYVHAHGTGTPLNDAMEAVALASAFGTERKRIPISSSKGQIGHTLGAAGAVGAAITALVVHRRTLVPTAGLEQPDPALGLVHVPRVGRRVERVRAALSNAFGFGGMDTVLVFAEDGVGDSASPCAKAVVVTGAAVLGPCGLVGVQGCATLPEKRFDPAAAVDPDCHLDEGRARRLDRASRLGTAAAQRALADAGGSTRLTGLILGSAYGNIDGCAAFLHRAFEKGPRSASPAEFPNLVPSSAAGHVSIYLGLRGPVLATADLAASGESAFVQSVQLVAAGLASQIVAGACEERSDIVDRAFCGLFAHASSQRHASRCDLAAALVVESESEAKERGAPVLACVRQMIEWRDDAVKALSSLRAPVAHPAEVVMARVEDDADILLGRTAWVRCSRSACAPALGESDGLGAVAIAVAAGRIATGRAREALVLGLAKGRGFAIVLAAP
jgi:3-oxoacyl-[acyl-carrier-protein] synthase II